MMKSSRSLTPAPYSPSLSRRCYENAHYAAKRAESRIVITFVEAPDTMNLSICFYRVARALRDSFLD